MDMNLCYADYNTAFDPASNFGNSIDFKTYVRKLQNSNSNISNNPPKEIVDKLAYINIIIQETYKKIHNHTNELTEEVKKSIAGLSDIKKEEYKTEFSTKFQIDNTAYVTYIRKAYDILNDISNQEDECEAALKHQNDIIDKTRALFSQYSALTGMVDMKNNIDSFTQNINDILNKLSSERDELLKKLVYTFLYSQFVTEKIGDPCLRNLTIYGCPVCLENQVDAFHSECGHTGCRNCLGKNDKCPVCRGPGEYHKIKTLYFNGPQIIKQKKDIEYPEHPITNLPYESPPPIDFQIVSLWNNPSSQLSNAVEVSFPNVTETPV